MLDIPVLIVGGGAVGLTASILLSQHGMRSRLVEHHPARRSCRKRYLVEQPDPRATFLTINATDRWSFLIHSIKHYGYTAADFVPARCVTPIRQAVGVADLPVSILGVSAWEASARVANRYRHDISRRRCGA